MRLVSSEVVFPLMVELADTLDLGSNIRKDVRVRISLGGFKKNKEEPMLRKIIKKFKKPNGIEVFYKGVEY